MKTTSYWTNYWKNRQIDWKVSYQNWDHPHRFLITALLSEMTWYSLFEVGVGAGANLINIVKHLPGRQLGGCDVSPDAIAAAQKTLVGAMLKVNPAHDIMLSDSASDIILSDMCLIYYDPLNIDKAIKEAKRVGRKGVVFLEFHSKSLWRRWALWYNSGYYAYDYQKLLSKHGFYDIRIIKVPEEAWPGGYPQKEFAYLIVAKIPKRK